MARQARGGSFHPEPAVIQYIVADFLFRGHFRWKSSYREGLRGNGPDNLTIPDNLYLKVK